MLEKLIFKAHKGILVKGVPTDRMTFTGAPKDGFINTKNCNNSTNRVVRHVVFFVCHESLGGTLKDMESCL